MFQGDPAPLLGVWGLIPLLLPLPLRLLVGVLANLCLRVEDLALGAAESVQVAPEVAREELPAVRGMGVDRVLLEEASRPALLLAGAGEAVDDLALLGALADLGLGGEVLLTHAGTNGHVKLERVGTAHLVGRALVAVVELVAHVLLVVVEEADGALALGVNARGGLLGGRNGSH